MPQMSQVLRERPIGILTAGMSTRAVARELNVHFSTISHLQRRFREFGSTSNRPHNKRPLERLVLAYPMDITRPLLDPLQFVYRANRYVDDAVKMGLHYILKHLDKPGNYARILFVDFSSAFNTIMPDLLSDKLTQLSVPTSIF